MKSYLDIVKQVLDQGQWKPNRTGEKALTISGAMFQHDMSLGFPLITTKKMAFKSVRVELEFFIKGITDKAWLRERGCRIWDEWCNPKKIPRELLSPDKVDERKKFQFEENDLGKIYGYQWNDFNGVNQLKQVVEKLKTDPTDRRMIVSAWNPTELAEMALPPCHVMFHLVVIDNKLNLNWFQRSCDLAIGIPFNIASYGLLLHLLALEAGLEEGTLTGMFSDVHIYQSHLDGARQQLTRTPYPLGKLVTEKSKDNKFKLWEWDYTQTRIENYQSHEKIALNIAI